MFGDEIVRKGLGEATNRPIVNPLRTSHRLTFEQAWIVLVNRTVAIESHHTMAFKVVQRAVLPPAPSGQ